MYYIESTEKSYRNWITNMKTLISAGRNLEDNFNGTLERLDGNFRISFSSEQDAMIFKLTFE